MAGIRQRSLSQYRSADFAEVAKIWQLYIPEVDLAADDRNYTTMFHLIAFLASSAGGNVMSQVKDDAGFFYLPLDFQQFRKMCNVDEFYITLEEYPRHALISLSVAVHKVLLSSWREGFSADDMKINIRLYNYPESMITVRNLKAAYIDKLVSVRGTVVKVSNVKPLVMQMGFSCVKCKTQIGRKFPYGKFSPPTRCDLYGCKSRTFCPIRSTSQTVDFQKIRVQEVMPFDNHEEGRVPRTVECELTEDLVDLCLPGDVVTVVGIICKINNYMDVGGG